MGPPARSAAVVGMLAGLLAGCSAIPGPTGAATTPAVAGTSVATATADVGPDTGSPSTAVTPGGPARPGLNGVPDPATLAPDAGPRTGPNLGDVRFVQPTITLSALPSSPVMGAGFAGAKAALIQAKFGLAIKAGQPYRKQELNAAVISAIRNFQADTGLTVSGQVGRQTWSAMFPGIPFDIDHWHVSPQLPLDAGPHARIEQMVSFIRSQIGAPYLWGGAGPKQYGYDCSGLMLQALYSAGLDPTPINVVDHQRPDYPTAKKLYNYPGFRHVPASQARRGDLVFFGNANNPASVTHVAMVLGNGFVLESITSLGVSEDHFYTSWGNGAYTMRADAVRLTS